MDEEVRKNLQRAERKLASARYLLKGEFWDDAISRAYYSMFYGAKALLLLKDVHPKSHKGVISQFGLEFVKKGFIEGVYGAALNFARDSRLKGDYGVDVEMEEEEAEEILKNAEEFLRKIKEVIEMMRNRKGD